jgi:hypothetical protein
MQVENTKGFAPDERDGMPVALDWGTWSYDVSRLVPVGRVLDRVFGEPIEKGGRWTYTHCVSYADKAVELLWSEDGRGEKSRSDACLVVMGSAWSRLTQVEAEGFIRDVLAACEADDGSGRTLLKCTRLDVRADDFERIIEPVAIRTRHLLDRSFSGARTCSYVESSNGEFDGGTVYLGRRGSTGSGVQLCIYDKRAESSGEIDCIRYESRYAAEQAEEAFAHLIEGLKENRFAASIGELVAGRWEFWLDGAEKNVDRRVRAPWWEAVKSRLGSVKFCLPRYASGVHLGISAVG